MSGSGGARDDGAVGAGTVKSEGDPCNRIWRGPINSPKAAVLASMSVGSVLGVEVKMPGSSPILTVTDCSGADAGSLTFVGYLAIIDCIQNRGVSYKATIINISGGIHEVRVEPQ